MENFNSILDAPETKQHYRYAGFWERFAASLIDGILLWVATIVIFSVSGIGILSSIAQGSDAFAVGLIVGLLTIPLLVTWLYFAYFESSDRQGTLGKRALDLCVTDLDGRRISFGQATGRYFGKFISSLFLCFGYLMQPFTERKQALHDLMAGTLVVKNRGWGA